MLTLLIGDFHIPERVIEVPSKFKKLLAPNPQLVPSNSKISKVVCLGNITNSVETLKFLHDLSPEFHLVRGEYDDTVILNQQLTNLNKTATTIPFHKTILVDNLRIGFTNGYQIIPKNDPLSLLTLARELNVDILVWGGTHKVEAYTLDGKFFINPGSATGAFSYDWPEEEDEEEEEEDEEDDVKEEEPELEEAKEDKPENDKESEEKESEKKQEEKAEEKIEEKEDETALGPELLDELSDLSSSIPSFCLLDTHGSKCTLYIYTYINGEVKVDKVTFQKEF